MPTAIALSKRLFLYCQIVKVCQKIGINYACLTQVKCPHPSPHPLGYRVYTSCLIYPGLGLILPNPP